MSVTLSGGSSEPIVIPFAWGPTNDTAQAFAASTKAPVQYKGPGEQTPEPETTDTPLLVSGTQTEAISTGNFAKVLINATSTVSVVGGSGNDVVVAGNSGIVYNTGGDYNTGGGKDTVLAGGGNNLIGANASSIQTNSFFGTGAGNDTIISSTGNNTIMAGGGDNQISLSLSNGNNVVYSQGKDIIWTGGGNDTIGVEDGATVVGGSGRLTFIGGTGNSTVAAGSGSSTIFGGAGTGSFWGGDAGYNSVTAAEGQSWVFTGGANSSGFASGAGSDTLVASAGNTTLSGGNSTGNNVFFSGTGDKVLVGGGVGNDTIFAGRGEFTVFGGKGADVFAFFTNQMDGHPTPSKHTVVIGDFTVGQDKLVFDGYTNVSIDLSQQNSGSTTLTLPDGTKIILSGVSLTSGGI